MRTHDSLLMEIRQFVINTGSQKVAADQIGVAQQYLCDVLKGRRFIGNKIARHFGYRTATGFVRINS